VPKKIFKQIPGSKGYQAIDFDLNKFFNYFVENEVTSNYGPIAQRTLGSSYMNNIVISGDVLTNFDADANPGFEGLCYILVRKNSTGIGKVECGYGIAFRPSTLNADVETTITSISDNYDGTYDVTLADANGLPVTGGAAYIARAKGGFPFSYISRSGNILSDCSFPVNITAVEGDTVNGAEDNVFIVDNDLIGHDIYSHHQIEHDGGIMSYVTAAAVKIEADVKYEYKLIISSENAIEFRIWETGSTMPVGADIESGAYTPTAEFLETADMDAFGIGIYGTKGYQWYFDDVYIASIAQEYPGAYFEINVLEFPEDIQAVVNAVGNGYNSSVATYGAQLYIWDSDEDEWTLIASNASTAITDDTAIYSSEFDKTTYANSNVIKFLVVPTYPSGTTGEANATIEVDYFKLIASKNSSMHIGGCSDVYIEDDYLVNEVIDRTITNGSIILPTHAIVWINTVSLAIDGGDNIPLVENRDFAWYVNDENYRYSEKVENTLTFATSLGSSTIEIDYYYSPYVSSCQDLVVDPFVSFKGQDVLVKHLNIHMLTVTSNVTNVETYLEDFIDTLVANDSGERYLKWSDFKEYMEDSNETVTTLLIKQTYRDENIITVENSITYGDMFTTDKLSCYKVAE